MGQSSSHVNSQSARTWTARDYLMTNRFCPPQQIQDRLKEHRLHVNAECAAVVAFDRASILKHLSFVTAGEPSEESRLRNLVFNLDREAIVGLEMDKLIEDGLISGAEVLDMVKEFGYPFSEMFTNAYMRTPPSESDTLGIVLLDDGEISREIHDSLLDELREMINGTALANVRREQKVSRLIRRASARYLIPDESTTDQHTRLQASLLKLATSVVPGAVAAYYAPDQTTFALRCAGVAPADASMIVVPSSVNLHASTTTYSVDSYISLAFTESKTYLNPGPMEVGPLPAGLREPQTGFAVLPVPSAALGRDAPNLGVLAVWRPLSNGNQAQITQSEITLLRNVALRLALTTDSERARISGEYLATFATTLSTANPELARQLDTQMDVPSRVPWDVQVSRKSLAELANYLWRATYSDSVSIRVLVTDSGEQGDIEFHLRQFLTVPNVGQSTEDEDVQLTGMSIEYPGRRLYEEYASTFAAATGEEVHISNMRGLISQQCPGLVRVGEVRDNAAVGSTFCMPIFVDGAVVGTIRLQSPFRNAYITQLPTIRAFGALAGVAIATTRREIVRHVSLRFASLRIGHHEAKNIAELLKYIEAAAPAVESQTGELRELTLGQEVYMTERLSDDQGSSKGIRLRDVVFPGQDDLGPNYAARIPEDLFLSVSDASLLLYATKEILRNIQRHSTTGSKHVVSARCYRLALGGDNQVCLTYRSRPKGDLVEEFLRTAYRAPIPDTNGGIRPHLGCFTAGQMVRVLGGDIFMDVTPSGFVETHVLLPSRLFR